MGPPVEAGNETKVDAGTDTFAPLFCSKYKCKSKCECAASKCKTDMDACYKDSACKKVYDCLAECACGDMMCAMKCKSSSSKAKALGNCEQKECKKGEAEVLQV